MIRYRARWVLPISARPIEDGVVAVDDGRIAFVGARAAAPAGEERDLGDAILSPGLVNVHTHLELTALRGFLEHLDFPRWITRLQAAKTAVLARDDLLDAARLGLLEGLNAGITTYADTCDSGVALDAMLEAGVRGVMFQEVFGPDPAAAAASLAALTARIDAIRPRTTPLVRVGVSPHAPYTVSNALYQAVGDYAARNGLPMAVHIAESDAEHQLVARAEGVFADALRRRGIGVERRARSAIDLLDLVGMLPRRPLLVHCVHVDARDIARIAACGAPVAHCPASNAKLGHGTAPLRSMLDAGITVGLGSDSMASNNVMDLLGESRIAILAQRVAAARPDALSAGAALTLATLGGARALGLDREIGSLEPGKAADLAAFAIPALRAPVHDPAAALVFGLSGGSAALVTVAGRELVRDGRVVNADPALHARVDAVAGRLRKWGNTE